MYQLQEGWMYIVSKEYRIKETIGPYWSRRYEVQEKYTYYENGKECVGWHNIFHSPDRKLADIVLEQRKRE